MTLEGKDGHTLVELVRLLSDFNPAFREIADRLEFEVKRADAAESERDKLRGLLTRCWENYNKANLVRRSNDD